MGKRERFLGMEVRDLDKEPTISESKTEKSPEEKNEKTASKTGVVKGCSMLNIRKSDDAASPVIKVVNAGTKLNILGDRGSWYNVESDGVVGYCMRQFVEVE